MSFFFICNSVLLQAHAFYSYMEFILLMFQDDFKTNNSKINSTYKCAHSVVLNPSIKAFIELSVLK